MATRSTIHPIWTEADWQAVLTEIDCLFDAQPGSEEFDRLEVLTVLAVDYQNKHHPIEAPSPLEAIQFRLEQGQLTRKDPESALGGRNRVSEVLNGKRRLSLEMIRTLRNQFGIPADSLIGC
jgi:HTH-type transcriptional regulator/antitoxin HigA